MKDLGTTSSCWNCPHVDYDSTGDMGYCDHPKTASANYRIGPAYTLRLDKIPTGCPLSDATPAITCSISATSEIKEPNP